MTIGTPARSPAARAAATRSACSATGRSGASRSSTPSSRLQPTAPASIAPAIVCAPPAPVGAGVVLRARGGARAEAGLEVRGHRLVDGRGDAPDGREHVLARQLLAV